jgi:hypothetical protein
MVCYVSFNDPSLTKTIQFNSIQYRQIFKKSWGAVCVCVCVCEVRSLQIRTQEYFGKEDYGVVLIREAKRRREEVFG